MTTEINEETKQSEDTIEVKIEDLKPKMSDLTITFKVIGKGESRDVSSRYSGEIHTVADATVGDETGTVQVPLWDKSIEEMKTGKTYRLENGYTGLFKGNLQLKIGRHSTLIESEDEIENVNRDVDMSIKSHRTTRDRGYYNPPRSRGNRRYGGYRPSYRGDRGSSYRSDRRRRW
jgi:ssDNA-binding replication factor A large subunit